MTAFVVCLLVVETCSVFRPSLCLGLSSHMVACARVPYIAEFVTFSLMKACSGPRLLLWLTLWSSHGSLLSDPIHSMTWYIVLNEAFSGHDARLRASCGVQIISGCSYLTWLAYAPVFHPRCWAGLGARRNIISVLTHRGIYPELHFVLEDGAGGTPLMSAGASRLGIMMSRSMQPRNFIVYNFFSWEYFYEQLLGHSIIFQTVLLRRSGALAFYQEIHDAGHSFWSTFATSLQTVTLNASPCFIITLRFT